MNCGIAIRLTSCCILLIVMVVISGVESALAGERRDLVFECPCDAEWSTDGGGSGGELSVSFGLRNHRNTDSGEFRLVPTRMEEDDRGSFWIQSNDSTAPTGRTGWMPIRY